MNSWKTIWNNKKTDGEFDSDSIEETFQYLKSLMGVASAEGIGFSDFRDQFDSNLAKIGGYSFDYKPQSYFEVGCGSGAYLYYLGRKNQKLTVGGIDYSEPLIEAAKNVLNSLKICIGELYCAEAIELDVDTKYDCVYSRSVFQYFPSAEYGLAVAEKMLQKARCCVGIFDLFDPQTKDDFLKYRRSVIEDYDVKYRETPHQFYQKESFLTLAQKNGCDVLFSRDPLKGYWNEPFVYDVYLYKRK